jgi:hypothetical protein
MSFDTLFDYGNAITFVDNLIDHANIQKNIVINELANIESNFGNSNVYANIINPKISSLNYKKILYEGVHDEYSNLKAEINSVVSLPQTDKNILANLYSNIMMLDERETNDVNNYFMVRMPYNKDDMIIKGNIILSDVSLTQTQKKCLAEALTSKYTVSDKLRPIMPLFHKTINLED